MKELANLKAHAAGYPGIICDLWGVIHDGRAAFPDAVAALKAMKADGKFVVLLSNSPRPSPSVKKQLAGLGVADDCYDVIVTSGDLAKEYMEGEARDATYFHLGPERDKPTIDGISNPKTQDPGRAEIILCTGFFEDQGFALDLYFPLLERALEKNLLFVCANPDKAVDIAGKRFPCAGALAAEYESRGGMVVWLGKPEKIAYEKCFQAAEQWAGRKFEPQDFLAIGDNLETDIKGAKNLGIETVFVAEGLHGRHGKMETFMDQAGVRPDAWIKRLKWD